VDLFDLAIDEPLTRRRLLGGCAGASAAIAAASLGLPAAAKALETIAAPGLSAEQRADCLALASTVASQAAIGLSGQSADAVVNSLSDDYSRAPQV
jgi:hypothetical protein